MRYSMRPTGSQEQSYSSWLVARGKVIHYVISWIKKYQCARNHEKTDANTNMKDVEAHIEVI